MPNKNNKNCFVILVWEITVAYKCHGKSKRQNGKKQIEQDKSKLIPPKANWLRQKQIGFFTKETVAQRNMKNSYLASSRSKSKAWIHKRTTLPGGWKKCFVKGVVLLYKMISIFGLSVALVCNIYWSSS